MKRKRTAAVLTALCICVCANAEPAAAQEEQPAREEEQEVYTCRSIDFYDYETAVPASDTIEDAYFNGALFGGDSRMGSLYLFSDLQSKGAEIHYMTSLSLWRIEDMELETAETNLYDILMHTDRNSIYLLIGINEIRAADFDAWIEEYRMLVQEIREAHPLCDIYLILCYHPIEISNISDEDLKEHIRMQNEGLIDIAKTEHVYWLDPDEVLADKTGKVREDIVWDGLHLNEEGSQMFADFIASHVARKDVYVKKVCE